MNQRVQLIPKTRKGKTICHNRGFLWDLDPVTMAGVTPPDTRLFIRSQDGLDFRWVHPTDDPNFEVSIPTMTCGMRLN